MQVGVKNLKLVGSQSWELMREGEAEKQVCSSSSFIYLFYLLPYPFFPSHVDGLLYCLVFARRSNTLR